MSSSSIITSSSTLTMAKYNIASGEEEGEVKVTLPFLPISTVSVSFSEEVENQLASSAHYGHHNRRRRRRCRRHARFGSFWSSEFKYQDILIILLTIIALFGLTFFLVLLLSSSSTSTQPDADERIPVDPVARLYLKTLQALQSPGGQVITSATSDNSDQHCPLKLIAPHLQINHPMRTFCFESGRRNGDSDDSWETYWKVMSHAGGGGSSSNPAWESPIQLYPFEGNSTSWNLFCLTVGNKLSNTLTVGVCEKADPPPPQQQFLITVEAVATAKSRAYFAIRHQNYSGECIDLCNHSKLGKLFLMQPCVDLKASQLFYLNAVNYTEEIAYYTMKAAQVANATAIAGAADAN